MTAVVLEFSNTVEGQEQAGTIGEVREEPARMVLMHTGFGGSRMIDMLVGDPLPRGSVEENAACPKTGWSV